jgi:CRP/FNR family transcriptional regulator, anaerobic regulatory protein
VVCTLLGAMGSFGPVPRLCRMFLVTGSNGSVALRDELVLGRRELSARFRALPPRALKAGELLASGSATNAIYHLVAGWACRFRDFSDGHQAIVAIYLPGDVIGLDAVSCTRSFEEVMTLTSIATEVIDAEDSLTDLMAYRPIAVYIAWLLGQRQRRSDRLLAAISSLDARGRLATMMLDFYSRLSRQRLLTGSTYNLPLTQIQIGAYLGLTVAHVNRVLRSFRDERILNVEKHCVTIFDLKRLSRLAQSGPLTSSIAGLDQRSLGEPMPAAGGRDVRIKVDSSQPGLRPAAPVESFPLDGSRLKFAPETI